MDTEKAGIRGFLFFQPPPGWWHIVGRQSPCVLEQNSGSRSLEVLDILIPTVPCLEELLLKLKVKLEGKLTAAFEHRQSTYRVIKEV